ncbi:MAG: hypothetical protein LBI18_06770 [Planctomycetaceae bacterium]|nr:hypothetical protein [Planctomycetaceae bacterium]
MSIWWATFCRRIFIHGRVGDSRPAPMLSRQLDSKLFGNNDYYPKTGTNCLTVMRPFGEDG